MQETAINRIQSVFITTLLCCLIFPLIATSSEPPLTLERRRGESDASYFARQRALERARAANQGQISQPQREPDIDFSQTTLEADIAQFAGKKLLVCCWAVDQTSSKRLIRDLANRTEELAENEVIPILLYCGKSSSSKMDAWLNEYQIPFLNGTPVSKIETVKQQWGISEIPWFILLNAQHEVQAYGFRLAELDRALDGHDLSKLLKWPCPLPRWRMGETRNSYMARLRAWANDNSIVLLQRRRGESDASYQARRRAAQRAQAAKQAREQETSSKKLQQ